MMDKIMTDENLAYVFPYSGSGHEISARQYDFYDNLFRLLNISEYNYYGELRRLAEPCAVNIPLSFYCVPGVWIHGNIEPFIELNVPFYGDDIVFPELLVPCLDTGMMLPPRFHHLANVGPESVYDYDFPCVAVNGELSSSIHQVPLFDTMQIENELYAKNYRMGLAVYSVMKTGNFMPLVKSKIQQGAAFICLYVTEPPRDQSLPYYDLGGGYYILFLPANMERDGKGFVIPGIGFGEVAINHNHIIETNNGYTFQ
jgi:hypothetical protein